MGLTLLPLHTQNSLEPVASPGAQGTAGLGSGCILHAPVLHKVLAQVLGSALPRLAPRPHPEPIQVSRTTSASSQVGLRDTLYKPIPDKVPHLITL